MCFYLLYKEAYVGHVLIDICVYHCVIRMLHFTGQTVLYFQVKNHDLVLNSTKKCHKGQGHASTVNTQEVCIYK